MNQKQRTISKLGIITVSLLCVFLAATAPAQSADSSRSSEYLIKAGFIYNFAKLIEWPAPAFSQPNSPIVIGILAEKDPFQGMLDDVLRGKQVNGHPFVVKHLKWNDDVKGCNILFVGSSEKAHFDDLFQSIQRLPILTIGETPGFAARGGIINFVLKDNRVRFDIDVRAAKHASITISSRLLTLAKIVPDASVPDGRKAQ